MTMYATESTAMESVERVFWELRNNKWKTIYQLDYMLRSIEQISLVDPIADAIINPVGRTVYEGSQQFQKIKESGAYIETPVGFIKKEFGSFIQGLKLYTLLTKDDNLSTLNDFANELRVAGRNGKLSGETFGSYNQHTRFKREFIQFGVPMFELIKVDETKRYIEPIPAILQDLIDKTIQWKYIPEDMRPNGCRINFFDEGEYSHPFEKPPHLEQSISILLLSKSKLAFGHKLIGDIVADGKGNYRGGFTFNPFPEGHFLVMNGEISESTHAMCTLPIKRITITFFKVRT
ncbi:hypothetical protein ABFS82_01G007000 [Erythranthe guttata]